MKDQKQVKNKHSKSKTRKGTKAYKIEKGNIGSKKRGRVLKWKTVGVMNEDQDIGQKLVRDTHLEKSEDPCE